MTENRWYPHRDYAGEPMRPGAFRDPQPTDPLEIAKRNAAIMAADRFCQAMGVPLPLLAEEIDAKGENVLVHRFIGEIDGRRFSIGYEILVS